MQITVLFGFLFATLAVGYGQQTKIALHDATLPVSGSISLEDDPSRAIRYTFRTEASIANVSHRDVVLTVVHFEANSVNAPGLDSNWVVDRFWPNGSSGR
jgi:hypothetical protein